MEFREFTKIPRLSREIIITEKIDGTNGVIAISEEGDFFVGSRKRWLFGLTGDSKLVLAPQNKNEDNHGFAIWASENMEELLRLGSGYHYGEWWGQGINRGYDLKEKKFSLFNVSRWADPLVRPSCCDVVPTLFTGVFDTLTIDEVLASLAYNGSMASPGYMNPEGIAIYHVAANCYFKKTIKHDEQPKGKEQS